MTFRTRDCASLATPNETDFSEPDGRALERRVGFRWAMGDGRCFEQEGWHRDADGNMSGVVYNDAGAGLPDAQT